MGTLSFKQIIGQEKAVAFLRQVIANDKIASAYLFTGIHGIGKTTTAIAFAMFLNCTDPADGDGCGQCPSCRRVIDGNHPDVMVIEPDSDKGAIRINQIREIERSLAFAPLHGRYRVTIIDPAEQMTTEAANAFLKTLEEPPQGNVFILNVKDPGELPPTIVSRCQRVPFRPLPTQEIENWLVMECAVDGEGAKILARLSEGSLGKAVRMAEDDLLAARVGWLQMLDSAIKGPPDAVLDTAQKFSELGKKAAPSKALIEDRIAVLLGIWKSWFRDLVLIKLEGAIGLIVNADMINHLREASHLYTTEGLVRSLTVIARAEHDLMDNKNSLILIEQSLFGLKRAASYD